MANGDTPGYGSESSVILESGMMNDNLQDSPICQLRMVFTEGISFRKVRLIFGSLFGGIFN